MSAPVHKQVRLAGAVIDRKRHVCAFFNSKEEAYRVLMPFIKEGFDQHRQIALIDRLLNSHRASGYPLTRLVGNMEWALEDKPGVNDLVEFELRVNYTLDKYDHAICCTYDLSRFSASVIMDAMRVHPAVIIGGIDQENPFYVPPDEFLSELRERNAKP
jgi:hypothetical protein